MPRYLVIYHHLSDMLFQLKLMVLWVLLTHNAIHPDVRHKYLLNLFTEPHFVRKLSLQLLTQKNLVHFQ